MSGPKGSLPEEVSSFVGRRREMVLVKELMTSSRLLTLTGTGGVGKTRLALRLAAETHRAFPDGSWVVELADIAQPGLVAARFLETFGLRDEGADTIEQLRDHLAERELLLIVDNCEHLVAESAHVIREVLAGAPSVRVVATSRQVLGVPGEQIYPVPPLTLSPFEVDEKKVSRGNDDAVALFVERARAAQPDFEITSENWPTVSDICRRLDGVPLAIELAAGRLRMMSEEQILARLDNALEILDTGPRTMPARQRRIEATMDWSYRLLTPAEQRLWRGISIFAGGFTLDTLEDLSAGAAIPWPDMFEALSGLVEKSIVVRRTVAGSPRYHLSEVLRQFGRRRLEESGEAASMLRSHLTHFARLSARGTADYCSPRDIEYMQAVRLEHANIRAAFEYALSSPDTVGVALAMAADLRPFWSHTGSPTEGYTWLRRALAAEDSVTGSAEHLKALTTATYLALMLAEIDDAAELLERCRAAIRDEQRMARAHLAFHETLAAFYDGRLEDAIFFGEEAAKLAAQIENEDPGLAAQALAGWALVAFMGRNPQAGQIADDMHAFTKRRGAHLLHAIALYIRGLIRSRAGDSGAEDELAQAVRILREFGDHSLLATAVEVLGWDAASHGELERAAQLFGFIDSLRRSAKLHIARSMSEAVGGDIRDDVQRRLGSSKWNKARERGAGMSEADGLDFVLRGTLKSAGASTPAPPASRRRAKAVAGVALTPREIQVAKLVADGLSNREIAARLVLSVRTAEAHVENILLKLSFHSRAEIGAWVHNRMSGV